MNKFPRIGTVERRLAVFARGTRDREEKMGEESGQTNGWTMAFDILEFRGTRITRMKRSIETSIKRSIQIERERERCEECMKKYIKTDRNK